MQESRKGLLFAIAALGIVVGASGAIAARSWLPSAAGAEAQPKKTCCSRKHATATPPVCPAHPGDQGIVVDNQAEALRLRRALRDGVFAPWVELGRAPTPEEVAQRLNLTLADADKLLDELEACGQVMTAGILRVPQSDLIAVAWPFSNVPTGIVVTVEGGRPAFSRCAIDSLGISKMLGRRATVEAEARDDGRRLRITVDGDNLVSAEPADPVVVYGDSCDDISFFSSRSAAERFLQDRGSSGTVLTLREALRHGARSFGRLTAGL